MSEILGDIRLVCVNKSRPDPALDLEAMGEDGIAKYAEVRDKNLLVFKANQTPTWFVFKRLTPTQYATAMDNMSGLNHRSLGVFRECLKGVVRPDGSVLDPSKHLVTLKLNDGTKIRVLSEEFIDDLGKAYGVKSLFELGHVVLEMSGMEDGQSGPFTCSVGLATPT